jgi:hypothetical protein
MGRNHNYGEKEQKRPFHLSAHERWIAGGVAETA